MNTCVRSSPGVGCRSRSAAMRAALLTSSPARAATASSRSAGLRPIRLSGIHRAQSTGLSISGHSCDTSPKKTSTQGLTEHLVSVLSCSRFRPAHVGSSGLKGPGELSAASAADPGRAARSPSGVCPFCPSPMRRHQITALFSAAHRLSCETLRRRDTVLAVLSRSTAGGSRRRGFPTRAGAMHERTRDEQSPGRRDAS